MKQTVWLILVGLCLLTVGSAYAGDARIGYVDLRKVLAESKAGQQATSEIKKIVSQREAGLKKQGEELNKLRQAFEKNKLLLSQSERETKQKELQEKVADFQQARADAQREIDQKQRDFANKVLPQIRDIIRDVAREKKLTLVLDRTQMPVLYAADSPDLTETVIRRFDAKGGN